MERTPGQSKIDHARELILEARANGIEFACVAMDSFYGRDSTLRRLLEVALAEGSQ